MSLQDVVDAMNEASKQSRADYHVTLGELIERFSEIDHKDRVVVFDVGGSPKKPHSYRGYYSDLGFEATEDEKTVAEVLEMAEEAHGEEFTGYKGGQFKMGDRTPLWKSEWGTTSGSFAITGINVTDNEVILQCSDV